MSVSLERNLYLYDEIGEKSCLEIVKQIHAINKEDDENEQSLKDFTRKPINLYLSSFGGVIYDGNGLVDVMETSVTPIHTYALGKVMSMGLQIFIHGEKRFVGKRTELLFHGPINAIRESTGLPSFITETDEMKKIYANIIEEFRTKTNTPIEKLQAIADSQNCWYMSAEEAIRYNIANEYITKPNKKEK